MQYRSWLLVAGNSERDLGEALAAGADVVVVDLDAAVPKEGKMHARALAGDWLKANRRLVLEQGETSRWVRINSFESRQWRDDLRAVMPGAPDGIILPRADGPESIRELAAEIYELEQAHGIAAGSTRILPMVGETARAALTIGAYAEVSMPRLAGLAWSADGLGQAINASRHREPRGSWTDTFRFLRAQTLLVAHASGVMALETVQGDPQDLKQLKLNAKAARADGFTGMLASTADQIAEINAAFTASEAELDSARQIVSAFDGGDDSEAVGVDRRRIAEGQLRMAKQMIGSDDPLSSQPRPFRIMRPA